MHLFFSIYYPKSIFINCIHGIVCHKVPLFLWKSSLLELLFLERCLRTYINVAPFEEEMASVGVARFIVVNPVVSPPS